jgi:hypothetical protein
MSKFIDMYFGPLNKDACAYFFILSFIFFVFLIVALFMQIIFVVKNYKIVNFKLIVNAGLLLINLFLIYFVNRLFYTMCNKSLA